jgi:hypothetical protein
VLLSPDESSSFEQPRKMNEDNTSIADVSFK